MATQWLDDFTIYGTDAGNAARMLNGPYAETTRSDLQVDPDPTAGGGTVLRKFGGGLGGDLRKVLSAAQTTIGCAARFWLASLPGATGVGECPTFASFRDLNNVAHIRISLNSAGNIVVYRNDNGGEVQIGITAAPVVIANAWRHMEFKVVLDVAAGSVEVRLEGTQVLLLAAIRTTSNLAGAVASCAQVAQQSCQDASGPALYMKHYILWDGTTAQDNNFFGSCAVYRCDPSADVALNWTPSAGVTGFDKINELTPDDDGSYISAPTPAPAAYVCALTDLPATVTSVKSVMVVHRSRKTDGGDGNIQAGIVSGASTGNGVDRAITTAYTYWTDLFDLDPNGNIAWTKLAVNAAQLKLNRTV